MRRQHITEVTFVSHARLRVGLEPWAFALTHRDEIDHYWALCLQKNSHFFNGVVFVMARWSIVSGVLDATFYRADFKSFLYWREHGYPPAHAFDAFGSAMVLTSDGHILLGQQAGGHINAGRSYLPGGFIDQRDCDEAGVIDIVDSVTRELAEETGLSLADVALRPGLLVVAIGSQVALCVAYDADCRAAAIQAQITEFLSGEPNPELVGVVCVGPATDLSALDVPDYTRLALAHQFGQPRNA
jgi:8-oxo-dGTP pyrophosphatase MutT (NUDIX family)